MTSKPRRARCASASCQSDRSKDESNMQEVGEGPDGPAQVAHIREGNSVPVLQVHVIAIRVVQLAGMILLN